MIKRLIANTFGPERSPKWDLILGLVFFIVLAVIAVGLYIGLFHWLVESTLEPLFNRPPESLLMQISIEYPSSPAEMAPTYSPFLAWLNAHMDLIVGVITLVGFVASALTLIVFLTMLVMTLRLKKENDGQRQ